MMLVFDVCTIEQLTVKESRGEREKRFSTQPIIMTVHKRQEISASENQFSL